jgi:hypothetical protein
MPNFLSGLLIGATSGAAGQGCADIVKIPSEIRRDRDEKSLIINENIARQRNTYLGQSGRNNQVNNAGTKLLINELFINKFRLDETPNKYNSGKYDFSDSDWLQIARLLNSSGQFYILHMYTQQKINEATETAEQVSLVASSGTSAALSGFDAMATAMGEGIDDFTKLLNNTIGTECSNLVQGATIAITGIGTSKIMSKLLTNLKRLVNDYKTSVQSKVETYRKIEEITKLTKQPPSGAQRELYIKDTFKDSEPGKFLEYRNFLSSQNVKLQTITSEYQSKLEEKDEIIKKMQSEYRTNTYEPAKQAIEYYETEEKSLLKSILDKLQRNKRNLEISDEVIKRLQQADSDKTSKFLEIDSDITDKFNREICEIDIESIKLYINENDTNIKELNDIYSILTQTTKSKIISVAASTFSGAVNFCKRSTQEFGDVLGVARKFGPLNFGGRKTRKNKRYSKRKNKRYSKRKNKHHHSRRKNKNKRHSKRRTRK